jgi:hypothetical protein
MERKSICLVMERDAPFMLSSSTWSPQISYLFPWSSTHLFSHFLPFALTFYLLLGLAGIDWMIMKRLKVKKFPYLKTSANKSHQIHIRPSTSSPISTLIHSVSLKMQNIKVVYLFLGVPQHLESSQSELL